MDEIQVFAFCYIIIHGTSPCRQFIDNEGIFRNPVLKANFKETRVDHSNPFIFFLLFLHFTFLLLEKKATLLFSEQIHSYC